MDGGVVCLSEYGDCPGPTVTRRSRGLEWEVPFDGSKRKNVVSCVYVCVLNGGPSLFTCTLIK